MADEPNTPNHRYYQLRNHIKLAESDMCKSLIFASGITKIDNYMILPLFALAEPGVWYDPSDLATLFQDSAGATPVTAAGQPVGKMLDKSGRGFHATQSISLQRPTYQIDSTGRPYLLFDGVDDNMVTGTITPGTDKVQVFAGVRKLSDLLVGIVCELSPVTGTSEGAFRLSAPHNVATPNYGFQSRGTAIATTTAATYTAPTTDILTALGDISASSNVLRVDGTQIGSSAASQGTGNYLAYPLYIGSRAGTSLFFNGRLYSLITRFGANLTADQIASTESLVNGKTGAC